MAVREYTDDDLSHERGHLKMYKIGDYLTASQVAEIVTENSGIKISSSDVYNLMRYRKVPDRGYFGAHGDADRDENGDAPRKRGQHGKRPRKYLYDDWRNLVISKSHAARPFKPVNEIQASALRVRKHRAKKRKEEAERDAARRLASGGEAGN